MDPQLVKLAQKGDARAFEAIVVAAHPTWFGVAYGVLRDVELAEDATQRACLDMWRFLPRLNDREGFDAWALGHLIAACRVAAPEAPSFSSDGDDEPALPSTSDPFGTVLDRDQISRAFRQLSFDERAVLVLRYLVDLQSGQAESALGLGREAMASRVEEALHTLNAAIDGDPTSTGKLVTQPEGT